MMVDPMFMIVQSLRSFLTAVTPTAVTPTAVTPVGAKPNLYCEAIELVCGGSPIGCVLVEWKAQGRVKWEGQQLKPVWISCLFSTSVQSWMISMGTICSSHFSLYRAFLSTRPTRLGEPPPVGLLLWSRGGLVIGKSMKPNYELYRHNIQCPKASLYINRSRTVAVAIHNSGSNYP